MQLIQVEDGQTVGEALAQAGAPDEVVALMNNIFGTDPAGPELSIFAQQGPEDEEDEGEFDVDFEPDFELSDEPEMAHEDKVEAVAQLGRILEGVSIAVETHASLLKSLVA